MKNKNYKIIDRISGIIYDIDSYKNCLEVLNSLKYNYNNNYKIIKNNNIITIKSID